MKYQALLSKILKSKDNLEPFESTIGRVVTPPPKLTISIWNGQVILEPNQLYMNDRLFNDHIRDYSLEGEITEESIDITASDMTKAGQGPHKHTLIGFSGSGSYKASGKITNTDTLKKGDLVKLTPTESGQIWFVDFKVRKLGG